MPKAFLARKKAKKQPTSNDSDNTSDGDDDLSTRREGHKQSSSAFRSSHDEGMAKESSRKRKAVSRTSHESDSHRGDDRHGPDADSSREPPVVIVWQEGEDHSMKKMFLCIFCNKQFSTGYQLKRHLASHSGHRRHVCGVCKASFVLSSSLSHHMRSHTGSKDHVCQECGQAFSRSSALTAHRKTHSTSKDHTCPICGKAFHQKGNLVSHINAHKGIKPFPCRKCPKAFSQLSNLKDHMWRTHREKQIFSCCKCSEGFEKRRDLREHERKAHGDDVSMTTGVPEDSTTPKTTSFHLNHPKTSEDCSDAVTMETTNWCQLLPHTVTMDTIKPSDDQLECVETQSDGNITEHSERNVAQSASACKIGDTTHVTGEHVQVTAETGRPGAEEGTKSGNTGSHSGSQHGMSAGNNHSGSQKELNLGNTHLAPKYGVNLGNDQIGPAKPINDVNASILNEKDDNEEIKNSESLFPDDLDIYRQELAAVEEEDPAVTRLTEPTRTTTRLTEPTRTTTRLTEPARATVKHSAVSPQTDPNVLGCTRAEFGERNVPVSHQKCAADITSSHVVQPGRILNDSARAEVYPLSCPGEAQTTCANSSIESKFLSSESSHTSDTVTEPIRNRIVYSGAERDSCRDQEIPVHVHTSSAPPKSDDISSNVEGVISSQLQCTTSSNTSHAPAVNELALAQTESRGCVPYVQVWEADSYLTALRHATPLYVQSTVTNSGCSQPSNNQDVLTKQEQNISSTAHAAPGLVGACISTNRPTYGHIVSTVYSGHGPVTTACSGLCGPANTGHGPVTSGFSQLPEPLNGGHGPVTVARSGLPESVSAGHGPVTSVCSQLPGPTSTGHGPVTSVYSEIPGAGSAGHGSVTSELLVPVRAGHGPVTSVFSQLPGHASAGHGPVTSVYSEIPGAGSAGHGSVTSELLVLVRAGHGPVTIDRDVLVTNGYQAHKPSMTTIQSDKTPRHTGKLPGITMATTQTINRMVIPKPCTTPNKSTKKSTPSTNKSFLSSIQSVYKILQNVTGEVESSQSPGKTPQLKSRGSYGAVHKKSALRSMKGRQCINMTMYTPDSATPKEFVLESQTGTPNIRKTVRSRTSEAGAGGWNGKWNIAVPRKKNQNIGEYIKSLAGDAELTSNGKPKTVKGLLAANTQAAQAR